VAVTLPRGGLLVSILVLPLTIPVLIFGVSATYAAVQGPAPFLPPFLILIALTLFFAVIGPLAAALGAAQHIGLIRAARLRARKCDRCRSRIRKTIMSETSLAITKFSDLANPTRFLALAGPRHAVDGRHHGALFAVGLYLSFTTEATTSRARRSASCTSMCRPPGCR
jgi:hypothetical protein